MILFQINCIYSDFVPCNSIGSCDSCPYYQGKNNRPDERTGEQITIEEVLNAKKEKRD